MIGTKKIVIVNGTNEEDIDMLADCVVRASENVVYHSILDGVKHIAHMANIHYPSKDSEKDKKLVDGLVSLFDDYCNLSLNRFTEILSGYFMLDDLDHAFIYTKYPEIEKKFIDYAHEKDFDVHTLFVESGKVSTCLSDKSSFETIIFNDGTVENLMDEVIKYICGRE